jgi:hypothetical protein
VRSISKPVAGVMAAAGADTRRAAVMRMPELVGQDFCGASGFGLVQQVVAG